MSLDVGVNCNVCATAIEKNRGMKYEPKTWAHSSYIILGKTPPFTLIIYMPIAKTIENVHSRVSS